MQGSLRLCVIVLLCAMTDNMCYAVVYSITPPGKCNSGINPCHTLSDFAANTKQLLKASTKLVVLEGEHKINAQFAIEQIVTFTMSSSHNATIKCENSRELQICKVGYAKLSNLKFRKC